MSRNYIEIEQSVFRNEILKKLNKEELQAKGYKTIIQNNYTFNRVESKYTLNDGISEYFGESVQLNSLQSVQSIPEQSVQ